MRHGTLRSIAPWVLAALAHLPTLPLEAKQVLLKLGGEQQVNVQFLGDQYSPAIAADGQGNYVVIWLGPEVQSLRDRIYARLFAPSGAPQSGEILVDEDNSQPFRVKEPPRVAMAADGRFTVVWSDDHVRARRFDAQGRPLGPTTQVDDDADLIGRSADLAMTPSGRSVITWASPSPLNTIFARRFAPDGQPIEPSRRLEQVILNGGERPRPAASAFGTFAIAWPRFRTAEFVRYNDEVVVSRSFDSGGEWLPAQVVNTSAGESLHWATPLFHPDGTFSIVWYARAIALTGDYSGRALVARRCDTAGRPLGSEIVLLQNPVLIEAPSLASDRFGNILVEFAFPIAPKLQGQLFDSNWKPVGNPLALATAELDEQRLPATASSGDGFVTTWTSGRQFPSSLPPPTSGDDGHFLGIFAQRLAPPLCADGSKVLCLGQGGRFELSMTWTTLAATQGVGRVHRLSDDTGAFWFFAPSNLELLAKVLDGRAVNGSFWVFTGALSDVDSILEVVDSQTGNHKTYHSPQGQLVSRADTAAFADLLPAHHRSTAKAEPGAEPPLRRTTAGVACDETDPAVLCLQLAHRFQVTVDYVDPRTGKHGSANALPLTGNTGAFSFFDRANLELVVKVLDGREFNGAFWVFYGGLSDLDYTIIVQDVATGSVRTYRNPHGHLESRADTGAFAPTPPLLP